MRAALGLARRALGVAWPNPAVGCVIVSASGRVVGRGTTAPGGRPHAETVALAMAGEAARGGTAYVTLEPCAHWGETPPCADALVDAGLVRIVIGADDPDPRVDGRGISRLREAGVQVATGVLEEEAREVAAGFLMRVTKGRPLVTLKLASTLDGRIATESGDSHWITAEPARRMAHALRGRHDAVMVGVGTVLADDPDLRCRIEGYRSRPVVRIVADSHLRTPLTARIVATAEEAPTWILHRQGIDEARREAFEDAGVELIAVAGTPLGLELSDAMQALGDAGLTRLLVEGGSQLAAAFLRARLVDRIAWFHAPSIIGGDGVPAAAGFGIATPSDAPRFVRRSVRPVGDDVLTELAVEAD